MEAEVDHVFFGKTLQPSWWFDANALFDEFCGSRSTYSQTDKLLLEAFEENEFEKLT